jgi:hypothetical protein
VLNNAPRDKVNRNAAGCANQKIDLMCRNLAGYAPIWRSARDGVFFTTDFMTPKQRLDRALQIRAALTDLMTDEENDNYEGLDEHFQDYINDLTLDHQKTLPDLPSL